MSETFSVETVAPALASLSVVQLRNLIKTRQAGQWMARMTYSGSQGDSLAPDSEAAAEHSGMSGDAEHEATRLLVELTEPERDSLMDQVWMEAGDAVTELRDLMPLEGMTGVM